MVKSFQKGHVLLPCGSTCRTEDEHSKSHEGGTTEALSRVIDVANMSTDAVAETVSLFRNQLASDIITISAACIFSKSFPQCDGKSNITLFASPFDAPRRENGRCETIDALCGGGGDGRQSLKVPLVYADHTASNRPVRSIERYMERVCLPLYGNTHTNTSITGCQSTAFVAEARQIVAEETNAKITGKASMDIVLFAGNGATSAVELLIDLLSIKMITSVEDQTDHVHHRPVVFVGPYEHHSNLIPWRETGCEIIVIPECSVTGNVDLAFLDRMLRKPEFNNSKLPRLKMGTFTAASNVTGKLCDVNAIAATLHRHGALAFFDYATAGPYTKIDMNPAASQQYPSTALVSKDAVVLSPHKMLGGVGTPGVLIVKKNLVNQVNAPSRSGGGTVFYVTNTHHRFLSNRVERYEGGTPNVTGIIRVGLTFLLKRQAEERYKRLRDLLAVKERADIPSTIEEFDCNTYVTVKRHLKEHAPNLVMLGSDERSRQLPIFSFLIRCGQRFLHYNYVCALLNDLFGIQSRGGCQCAGPYSQQLLGLIERTADGDVPKLQNMAIEDALFRFKEQAELLRPGYTRISLPFKGTREVEHDYIVKAIVWVAHNGWALMCQYRCNHRTGEWRHSSRQGKPLGRDERRWLSHYVAAAVYEEQEASSSVAHTVLDDLLEDALRNADKVLAAAKVDHRSIVEASKMADVDAGRRLDDTGQLEKLRWYVYPKECAAILSEGSEQWLSSDGILGGLDPFSSAISNDKKRKPSVDDDDDYDPRHSSTDAVAKPNLPPIVSINFGFDRDEPVAQMVSVVNTPAKSMLGNSSVEPSVRSEKPDKKSSRTSSTWGNVSGISRLRGNGETSEIDQRSIVQHGLMVASEPKDRKHKHVQPPPKLMRTITQAIVQWEMIKDGDRLLLGLSGGKDSLSLLHCLLELKRKLPIQFDIQVCTIDPMTPSFDPSSLIPYVESLDLKYHYIRDNIVARATNAGKNGKMVSSLCAFCARMKRGNLYSCARENKCNKLVLAQHLDDCAESMMMSMMHNGFLRTMKANYAIDAGDISVIRPLIYCRESLMTDFAKSKRLPVINENCPACFEEPKERARIKKMLNREETLYPNFYDNIRRSLIPLMHDDMATIFRSYTEEVVARSRKVPYSRSDEKVSITTVSDASETPSVMNSTPSLADISEHELLRELALRKAKRYKSTAVPLAEVGDIALSDIPDATGQVCTLNGGHGSIPCSELME